MSHSLSALLLHDFSHFITKEIGLYFPQNKWQDLERGMQTAAIHFGYDNTAACMKWLMTAHLTQKQIEILASYLTVGETYFFRDAKLFTLLESKILPQLIHQHKKTKNLRIWSAGCATGEEAYTVAIILHRLLPDINQWNITLLATDINIEFLEKVKKGSYTEWSFRNVPASIKEIYFTRDTDGKYLLKPEIKALVESFYLNLSADSYPLLINKTNAMDIIFCRNVLMYFSPEKIKKVISQFYYCLADEGWLITGPGEGVSDWYKPFKVQIIDKVPFYKKDPSSTHRLIDIDDSENTIKNTETYKETILNQPQINSLKYKSVAEKSAIEYKIPTEKNPMGHKSPAKENATEYKSPTKKNVMEYKTLAEKNANEGHLDIALEYCDKAIHENKCDAKLYYLRAVILIELNKKAEALIALNQVLYLDPYFVTAYISLGHLAYQKKEYQKAKNYFGDALTILKKMNPDEILPETGEMTVARLIEVINTTCEMEENR